MRKKISRQRKTKSFSITVPAELAAKIDRAAAAQYRSRSSFLVWLIGNDKKESAKWPIEPEPRKSVEIPPAEEPPVSEAIHPKAASEHFGRADRGSYKVEVILGCGDFGDYVGCNVDKRRAQEPPPSHFTRIPIPGEAIVETC